MRILLVGDVVGKPGRKAVQQLLPALRAEYGLDAVFINAENAAGGAGVTPDTAKELLDAGADVLTSGNHIWAMKEIIPYLDSGAPLLRPMNYPPGVPGRGYWQTDRFLVLNLIGRTFMGAVDCPFRTADSFLNAVKDKPRVIVVDFHAEATSEKVALGRYLDGRVSAVLGTHTHVGTVDACVLPRGTAYVTDVGMTGPVDSVIGVDADSVVRRFLTSLPHRLDPAKGRVSLSAVMLDVDEATGVSRGITRISREAEP